MLLKAFISLLFLSFLGCAEGGNFGAIGKRSSSDDGDEEETGEEIASEPTEVSGAFLTCAFMDGPDAVVQKVKDGANNPQVEIDVGCGVYRENTKVNTSRLAFQWMIHYQGNKIDILQPMMSTRDFEAVLRIKAQHYVDKIVMVVTAPDGKRAIRQKSVKTIVSFNGRAGFDIDKDIQTNIALFQDLSANKPDADPAPTPVPANVNEDKDFCEKIAALNITFYGQALNCNTIVDVFFGAPPARPQQVEAVPANSSSGSPYPSNNNQNSTQTQTTNSNQNTYDEVPFDPYSDQFQNAGKEESSGEVKPTDDVVDPGGAQTGGDTTSDGSTDDTATTSGDPVANPDGGETDPPQNPNDTGGGTTDGTTDGGQTDGGQTDGTTTGSTDT